MRSDVGICSIFSLAMNCTRTLPQLICGLFLAVTTWYTWGRWWAAPWYSPALSHYWQTIHTRSSPLAFTAHHSR